MKHRRPRIESLPARILVLVGIASLLAPAAAGAPYAVVPGSAGNTIRLGVSCPPSWTVAAEIVSLPAWMTHAALGSGGPGSDVRLDFDVDPAAGPGLSGTVVVSITARDARGVVAGTALRRVPLSLREAAPPVQGSDRIEECCLPAAGIEGAADGRPDRPVLLGASPNPWSASTQIRFGLPARAGVTLRILDVAGRLLRQTTLPEASAGYHQIAWDGCGAGGERLPPGLYFYELSSGRWTATGKTLLIR